MGSENNIKLFLQVLLSWHLLLYSPTYGYMVGNNPNRRADFLDPEGKYYLEWTVNLEKRLITFNVTVQTRGWILLGLANNNNEETGKDVVIGGTLDQTGQSYFTDRHQEGNRKSSRADLDRSHDYKLEQAWERGGETFISFSRRLDTCDDEDYPITENKATITWGYGEDDNYDKSWSKGKQGSYEVYLLDPEHTPKIIRDDTGSPDKLIGGPLEQNLQTWAISTRIIMPRKHTSYICSIHKAPRLKNKHHVVGHQVYFPNQQSEEHVNHFTVYKCNAPVGYSAKSLFEQYVGGPGESCFFPGRPPPRRNPRRMPYHLCGQLYTGWAIGPKGYFHPPHVGSPLGENPDEYFMVQVHYDNPQQKANVDVSVSMDFWYTPRLRRNDAGMMVAGIDVAAPPPTIMVPPRSTSHRVLGHCSSECTSRFYPPEGITITAVLLHSHNSGKAMRLRHFDMEKNLELPWVSYDDNYSNRFQAFRHLREPVQVLPGDQLTVECTYDNTWTNGSVIQGYSTSQEMCSAFFYYYGPVRDYSQCRSQIVSESARKYFLGGLENVTWSENRVDWVALSPRRLAGLTVTEIADGLRWDAGMRAEMQKFHETALSLGSCSRDLFARGRESLRQALETRAQAPNVYPPLRVETEDDFSGLVGYPFDAKPYVPPKQNSCEASKGWDNTLSYHLSTGKL